MTDHDVAVLYNFVDMMRLLKLYEESREASAEEGDESNE